MSVIKGKHILTGQSGEATATAYLRNNGYEILHRNYKYRKTEIDIIAKKNNLVIFFEVKTRATDVFGFPEEAVNRKKEKTIIKVADHYIHATKWPYDIRFDIIAITLTSPPTIHHIEDAFY